MKLSKAIIAFRDGMDGIVTVEWVILTAAVIGLAVAVLTAVRAGGRVSRKTSPAG